MIDVEAAVPELEAFATARLRFRPTDFMGAALARMVRAEIDRGRDLEEILAAARAGSPSIAERIAAAVSVPETYFFRHPDQLALLRRELIPARIAAGARALRAWSAGCATGEEAYSLAACLLEGAVGTGAVVEVLGTDLVSEHLEIARAATYRRWSVRDEDAVPARVLDRLPGGALRVADPVRAVVRFARHDLFDAPPAPPGGFDIVLCRNVLAYLVPDAIRAVCERLVAGLAPGGVLVLGPFDPPDLPPGLRQIAAAVFVREEESRSASVSAPPPSIARPESAPPPIVRPPSAPPSIARPESAPPSIARPPSEEAARPAVDAHLSALRAVEAGEIEVAARALDTLLVAYRDYLPARLERALVHARAGELAAAADLMREVARRAAALPAGELVPGPEPLLPSYYLATAEAFLGAQGTR